jgi:hypothetical protein
MSKAAAIDLAVRQQLASDGKALPATYREVMRDAPYNYNSPTMRAFLLNVANRLKIDVPPMNFDWKMINVDDCLAGDVKTLEGYIASVTN